MKGKTMTKWAVLISAVGLAFAVSGCSSDYVMATKDGRMILTDGKPEVDDDTGLISYEISRAIRCRSTAMTYRKSLNDNDEGQPPAGLFSFSAFPFSSPLPFLYSFVGTLSRRC